MRLFGITLGILIIIHIGLNFKWMKQVTKNLKKVNTKTKVMYSVDIFTALIYLGAIFCGILISDKIFNFHMSSNLYLVLGHLILGRLAIVSMFIHLGLHFDRILTKIKNKKSENVNLHCLYSYCFVACNLFLLYINTQFSMAICLWKDGLVKK